MKTTELNEEEEEETTSPSVSAWSGTPDFGFSALISTCHSVSLVSVSVRCVPLPLFNYLHTTTQLLAFSFYFFTSWLWDWNWKWKSEGLVVITPHFCLSESPQAWSKLTRPLNLLGAEFHRDLGKVAHWIKWSNTLWKVSLAYNVLLLQACRVHKYNVHHMYVFFCTVHAINNQCWIWTHLWRSSHES